jgi:predicted nucleic acid-binding protein
MAQRYGIDTSILVRLLTRDPEKDFEYCISKLTGLVDAGDGEIFVSNQVIGEAYVAVQHHYGVTKTDARSALLDVLQSGLIAPLNGRSTIESLSATGGPGLFDRLIANDYSRAEMETLTLDRRMASLPAVQRL